MREHSLLIEFSMNKEYNESYDIGHGGGDENEATEGSKDRISLPEKLNMSMRMSPEENNI